MLKIINWLRGTLRLWIVATVVWCAVVVVHNWNEMAASSETVHIKFSDTETWDYPVKWGVERIQADLNKRIDAQNKAEQDLRKCDRPDAPVPRWQCDPLVVPDGRQAEVKAVSQATLQAIAKLALWALGPPLIALALSLSLIWAFAGFRRA
jgi:hypothetical protein